jgi:DNA polymerase-3 subunit beta
VLPEADFPDLPRANSPSLPARGEDLKRLIDKTQFAISYRGDAYYLNGIYFHVLDVRGEPMLRAVATDATGSLSVQLPAPRERRHAGVIVPRKTVARCFGCSMTRAKASTCTSRPPRSAS